jgi:hypothetical protein
VGKKKTKAIKAKYVGKTPAETVRNLMKAGKVKKKCCKSKDRCGKCPVLALRRAKEAAA